MTDEKGIALAILGITAVIAVVGLVLLFTGANTGDVVWVGPKTYGGATKNVDLPYLEQRKFGAYGDQAVGAESGVPRRTLSRAATQIPSVIGSCGEGMVRVSNQEMLALYARGAKCTEFAGGGYCCTNIGAGGLA